MDEPQRLLDKKDKFSVCVCVCVCVCELSSKITVFEYTNFIFHTALGGGGTLSLNYVYSGSYMKHECKIDY